MQIRKLRAGAYGVDADFEGRVQKKLSSEYNERVQFCDRKNSQLQSTAEEMRLSILGKDSKTKDEKPLEVVETYVKKIQQSWWIRLMLRRKWRR